MVHDPQLYRYRIDADDRLVWVDRLWLAFASENGASELTEDFVLGRLLWDFIVGDETCQVYSSIHTRVRGSGQPVVIPFRCDSPTLKRHMRLTIAREEAGQLLYMSSLLRVEPQRELPALDRALPRSLNFLTMCSFCKRTLLESVGWLDVEDVSARLGLFEAPVVPELRYVVCPECGSTKSARVP